MADPVFVDCPAGEWKKVVTNAMSGQIHKFDLKPQEYLHTYRMTGNPAPTLISEGIRVFIGSDISVAISAAIGIDVYLWAVTTAGRVRVDV